ncbi:MAG: hypothetical protein IAG13_26665 [Deltaproteobacteria bacterium]|nr:hypothetical protein [Nannocystaceae bacterium]
MQIVMQVDTWERQLPWDPEAVLGESFSPPFRLRMSFSLHGGGGSAYLTLAAPTRVTETAPYLGSSYAQTVQDGAYLGGTWRGESALQAVPAGETEPVTIVRDVWRVRGSTARCHRGAGARPRRSGRSRRASSYGAVGRQRPITWSSGAVTRCRWR